MLDDDRFSAVVLVGLASGLLVIAFIAAEAWPLFVVLAIACSTLAAYAEFVGTPGWMKVLATYSGSYRPRKPARQKIRGWR